MSKVEVSDLLVEDILSIVVFDAEHLALSVEAVDFLHLVVVEGLVGEVCLVALQLLLVRLTNNIVEVQIIQEVIVSPGEVVEQTNEECVLVNEDAVHEGLREGVVAHGAGVDAQDLVHLDFCLINLLWSPVLSAKHSDSELAIIIVTGSKPLTVSCLLDFFELDVALKDKVLIGILFGWLLTNQLLECALV